MFTTAAPNADLVLYEGRLRVDPNGFDLEGDGRIDVRWLPRPRLVFLCSGVSESFFGFDKERIEIRIDHPVAQIRGIPTKANTRAIGSGSERTSVEGVVIDRQVRWRVGTKRIAKIHTHIPNLPDFLYSRAVEVGLSGAKAKRVQFSAAGWYFALDTAPDALELLEALKGEGGYAITHHLAVERSDRKTFSRADADRVLQGLFYVLSFAQGGWTCPMLSSYMSREGGLVYQDWSLPKLDSWRPVRTWFDPTLHAELGHVLDGFLTLRSDIRQDVILAMSYFVDASRQASPEASMFLAQAGLELMAWVALVEVHALYKPTHFDGRPAAERIEMLLAWASIPKTVPSGAQNLRRFAKGSGVASGPRAINRLRRGIAHPTHRKDTFSSTGRQRYEAAQLCLRYLELTILKLLSYSGKHANRMRRRAWVGSVERVPWA